MKDYVNFCLTVILQRFGPSAHQVAQVLVQRNGLCLADIARRSHLLPDTVLHVLTVLLQHDIIRVTAPLSAVKPDKSQLNKDRRAKVCRRPVRRNGGDSDDDFGDDDDYTVNEPASISGQTTGAAAGLFGDRGSGGPLSTVYRQRRLGIAHPSIVTLRDGNGNPIGNPGARAAATHKRLHYYLDLNIIRGFSRLTDYILIARRLWGDEGMAIVEEFAAMGKRTAAQVVTAVVARIEAQNATAERNRLQEEAEEDGEMPLPDLTSLDVMAALPEGLLSVILEKGDNLDPETRKRVIAAVSATSASLEEKVVKTVRKLIDGNYLVPSTNYCDEKMSQRASRKRRLEGAGPQSSADVKAIEEGKSDPLGLSGSASAAGAGAAAVADMGAAVKSTHLTLCHDRFSLHMLSDMAYGYVAGLAGHDAARITVALLKHHLDGADKGGFTEDRIMVLVNSLEAGELPEDAPEAPPLLPAAVATAVARLCHISMDVIAPIRSAAGAHASSSGPFYLLPERLLQRMRLDAAKTIIRERCGALAARVFALLSDRSRLEEKQISDLTLIPKKEAKEALYSLLQSHFVELQEVPRTADRQPSKAFYLWSLPYTTLGATVLAAALRSWGNLQLRMGAESAPLQGLLDKTNARVQLSDAEHQKVNLWAYKLAKVDVVSRGLNQLVLLFKDFTV